MNKDFMKRIMLAQSYQMKAIKVMLPDWLNDKVDQLSQEFIEAAREVFMESQGHDGSKGKDAKTENKTVKKVDID